MQIKLSNATYDVLKLLTTVVLPALATLAISITTVWDIPNGELIGETIAAIITFVNTVLGALIMKSSSDYHNEQE